MGVGRDYANTIEFNVVTVRCAYARTDYAGWGGVGGVPIQVQSTCAMC